MCISWDIVPYKCWNHLLSLHSHDITCKPAQSCKRILWFVTACNKSHWLCLSLTLPNDYLCQDLSGHCVLCCAVPRQPWPALVSLSRASTSGATSQKRAPLEISVFPLLIASTLLHCRVQPKATFSVGKHSLSRSLFPKCWVEDSTDMGSHHTALSRTAYSSVSTHVIRPV